MNPRRLTLFATLFLCPALTLAQSPQKALEKESAAILELGAATSWNVHGGRPGFGPTVAVELTPIEHWLELEAGVTPLFSRHSREWSTDLLFKKPWSLSRKVEFMVGIGPEWVRSTERGVTTNAFAGEAVADFMFWRSAKHKFGFYVEPGYERKFGPSREHSLVVSGGLLIAIP